MKKYRTHLCLFLLITAIRVAAQDSIPLTRWKVNVTDTLFNTPITDPYRWLEAINSDSTKKWLAYQRKLTQTERQKFSGRYADLMIKMQYSGFWLYNFIKEGPYYFNQVYSTEHSSPILYYRYGFGMADSTEAFNPNKYYGNGKATIAGYAVSGDSQNLAVALSRAGSDWCEIRVRNIIRNKDLPDKLDWVKFSSIEWFEDGFFYLRFKKPENGQLHLEANTKQQLCYHKLGKPQQEDEVIYAVPDEANGVFDFDLTNNRRYLIIYGGAKIRREWCKFVAYKDLAKGLYTELKIFIATPTKEEIDYEVIDLIDGKFVVKTTLNAPMGRVLLYNPDSVNKAEVLINQYKKDVLKTVDHYGTKLLATFFNNGIYTVGVFNHTGELVHAINFPAGVNINGFYPGPNDSTVLYFQNSFYTPAVAYTFNVNTYKIKLVASTLVHFSPDDYTTSVEIYKSKDGTEIPMYLTYKKKTKLNGNHPVLLYGYGGFGISVDPFYDFTNIILFENSGILAVPLIRGGGELGEQWHKQGKLFNKQNSFDDFIAAAEHLIAKGYTTKDRLAIMGASNGGLLTAAVLTQRPDLFKVAVAQVGVYDMIRYPLYTAGRFFQHEYGTPRDSAQFFNLLKYSPLHNLKDSTDYPATLIVTAENDDRVPPLHSYKFLAALQEKSFNAKPHILYFEEDAGHNGAVTLDFRQRANSFALAFIFKQMGLALTTNF